MRMSQIQTPNHTSTKHVTFDMLDQAHCKKTVENSVSQHWSQHLESQIDIIPHHSTGSATATQQLLQQPPCISAVARNNQQLHATCIMHMHMHATFSSIIHGLSLPYGISLHPTTHTYGKLSHADLPEQNKRPWNWSTAPLQHTMSRVSCGKFPMARLQRHLSHCWVAPHHVRQ